MKYLAEFIPESGQYRSLKQIFPQGKLQWFSVCALWSLFAFFLYHWVQSNMGMLFDPMLQTDDARQHLFAFHRYTAGKALAGDPIANEYLHQLPPLFRLFYAFFVPWLGVYVTPKIVQFLCLFIIFWAGYKLLRSAHGGLASGLLIIFCNLHTSFVVDRMAGGLPRSFAFPLMSLWIAGSLGRDERLRFIAIILCSMLYPPAALILLLAQSFYLFKCQRFLDIFLSKELKKFVALGLICLSVVFVHSVLKSQYAGKLPTLEQAKNDPVFYRGGRTVKLPFPDTLQYTKKTFMNFFQPVSEQFSAETIRHKQKPFRLDKEFDRYIIIPVVCLLLAGTGISSSPFVAFMLFTSSLLLYSIACAIAFSLYIPQRYCQFGMPIAAIALMVSTIGFSWIKIGDNRERAFLRNITTFVFILSLVCLTGWHPKPDKGMTINGRNKAEIKATISKLPLNVLISGHPRDLDPIPYWTGRATTDNYETTLPWLTKSWEQKKVRVMESLLTLYSLDREQVLNYFQKHGITHLLLNKKRYGRKFRYKALLFEPFNSLLSTYFKKVRREDFVLSPEKLPKEAILMVEGNLFLIDLARLEKIWQGKAEKMGN